MTVGRLVAALLSLLWLLPRPALSHAPLFPGMELLPPDELQKDHHAVVLTVNGHTLLRSQFHESLGTQLYAEGLRQNDWSFSPDEVAATKRTVLERKIGELLLYHEARRHGIAAGREQVAERLRELERHLPGGRTVGEVLEANNIEAANFRLLVERSVVIRLYAERLTGEAVVTEAMIGDAFRKERQALALPERIRLGHIQTTDRQEAERARQRVTAGEPFEQVAREVSRAPSAASGGDQGWVRREQLPSGLADAAFGLSVGSCSQVIESGRGYHLLRVAGREPARPARLDEVRNTLRERLLKEQRERLLSREIARLRKGAKVIVAPDL